MFLKACRFPGSRLRRWGVRGLGAGGILALFVFLAPSLVASRFVWPHLVEHLTADVAGRVSTGDVSLGWFSPVVVRDVVVQDSQGVDLATIATVRTRKSLLALVVRHTDLGVIRVEQPRGAIALREGGSDWEDVFREVLNRESGGSQTGGTIEIVDGQVDVLDDAKVLHGRLESIHATVELSNTDAQPGTVQLIRCLMQTPGHAGSCVADATWRTEGDTWHLAVSAKLDSVGLSLCGPLARRLGQAIDIQGAMTADLRCVWEGTGRGEMEARSLRVESLDVTAPDFLGPDQLRMRSLDVRGNCAIDHGAWTIRGARLECDAGHLAAEGQFRWQPGSDEPLWRTVSASIASADLVLEGTLDLAALARTLPRTLRVREDAKIESGTVRFELAGRRGTGRRQFQASIETSNLAAVREGQRFAWNDPLRANIEAEETDGSWWVRRLICEFAVPDADRRREARSRPAGFPVRSRPIDERAASVCRFGGVGASGVLTSRLNWDTADQGIVSARGTGSIQDVQLTHGTMRWSEPQLSATLAVECDLAGERLSRIRAARLELVSATDRLDLRLLEGVTDPSRDSVWPLACRASGEWSSWLERVRPMLPAGGWEASGPVELEITAHVSALAADVQQAVIRCEPFRLRGDALRIEEPAIAIEGNGRWDWQAGRGSVTQGTFQSAVPGFSCQRRVTRRGRPGDSVDRGSRVSIRSGSLELLMADSGPA